MSAYQHIKIGPLKQSELEEADRIGVELKFRARCLAEEREVGALSAGSMPEGVWNVKKIRRLALALAPRLADLDHLRARLALPASVRTVPSSQPPG